MEPRGITTTVVMATMLIHGSGTVEAWVQAAASVDLPVPRQRVCSQHQCGFQGAAATLLPRLHLPPRPLATHLAVGTEDTMDCMVTATATTGQGEGAQAAVDYSPAVLVVAEEVGQVATTCPSEAIAQGWFRLLLHNYLLVTLNSSRAGVVVELFLCADAVSVGGRPASAGPEFTALGTSDTGHGHGHYHRLQSQQHDQHGRSMHRSNSSSGKNTRPTSAHPTASRGDSERQMTRPSSASGYPRNSMSRYNMQLEVNTAMQLGSGLPSPGSGAASMPGAAADLSFMPAGSGHRAARAAAGAAGAGAASGGGAQYNSSNSAPRSSGAGRRTPTAFGDPAVDAIEEDTSDGAATASAAATASDGGAGGHKATRGGRARGLVLNGGATGSPVTISAASPTTSKRGSTSLQTTANRGYNTRLPADGVMAWGPR